MLPAKYQPNPPGGSGEEDFFKGVVYLWGFYDIKFKLSQYKSKLGLIPQYT